MTQTVDATPTRSKLMGNERTYDKWMDAQGIPVYHGHFIEDLRTMKLGRWESRECDAAIIQLSGQEKVDEARVTEIRPGATLPRYKFAFDEIVYVVEGRGMTTVWSPDGRSSTSFEWGKHALFILPRHHPHQFSNMQGHAPARLLHYNNLPTAMGIVNDPDFFFDNSYTGSDVLSSEADFFSAAKSVYHPGAPGKSSWWYGNFFPDMKVWDKLDTYQARGAGGYSVRIRFPSAPIWTHMSAFPPYTYKKAHRHGPGALIVIPEGEGYSVMWPQGKDKVFIHWHEGSVFVPPARWFHQHFNLGAVPARYMASHASRDLSDWEQRENANDEIQYTDEDPIIRETFERELAQRNLKNEMPPEVYTNRDYLWEYPGDE